MYIHSLYNYCNLKCKGLATIQNVFTGLGIELLVVKKVLYKSLAKKVCIQMYFTEKTIDQQSMRKYLNCIYFY